MRKQTTTGSQASRVCPVPDKRVIWDNLEEWVRRKVQGFIQSLLEEEVTELIGREKSERRQAIDSLPVYRNGHGKARRLTLGCGTVTVHRPRVRGLEERFESRVLPLFARRTAEVNKLIPQLYLHGLALGDFDLALRGLLGEAAPVSASTVARLKGSWQAEWDEWQKRPLDGLRATLEIKDNGKGFAVPEHLDDFSNAGHLGLLGMHELAVLLGGRLEIKSRPGSGTVIKVRVD